MIGYLKFVIEYLGFEYNQTYKLFCVYNENKH